jgi:glycine oxidase
MLFETMMRKLFLYIALLQSPRHLSALLQPIRTRSVLTRVNCDLGALHVSRNQRMEMPLLEPQKHDVVIVGGALAGLSVAFYLRQMDPTCSVCVVDREDADAVPQKQPVASFAAAGMLAPQSERLSPGPLLDLCMASRQMYPSFCQQVEALAKEWGEATSDRNDTTTSNDSSENPWSVGYMVTGGFLAPAFAGDAVATWAPPEDAGSALWLDALQVREFEPTLHPDVVGGWWFPNDASVDARRLTRSLRAACRALGVHMLNGPQYEVSSLDLVDGQCRGLWFHPAASKRGSGPQYLSAQTVVVANGAWMRHLLPIPIESHKGQSLSLRMPADRPPLLRRVIFAQDTYIVPKADGRIIIGATVEAGAYDGAVTPMGVLHVLTHALQMVPALKDCPIEEMWAGLRPTTPDKGPILGATPWGNLFVAGGYWRNGVLLAPKTGQLLASLLVAHRANTTDTAVLALPDAAFLQVFAWDRFTTAAGSGALAAEARIAAARHPVHRRSRQGVAAAVGTELGTYSSARAAVEDRKQDREQLWGAAAGDDAALERAAAQGKQDALAYSFGGDTTEKEEEDDPWVVPVSDEDRSVVTTESAYYMDGAVDALTVGSADVIDEVEDHDTVEKDSPVRSASANDLQSLYAKIQANKAQKHVVLDTENMEDSKPDPGFRIYHVDPVTRELREVPPYTSPGDFLASIPKKSDPEDPVDAKRSQSYDETTYDGYQVIQQTNAREYRSDELEAMREARRKNRLGQTDIDFSKIGAQRMED